MRAWSAYWRPQKIKETYCVTESLCISWNFSDTLIDLNNFICSYETILHVAHVNDEANYVHVHEHIVFAPLLWFMSKFNCVSIWANVSAHNIYFRYWNRKMTKRYKQNELESLVAGQKPVLKSEFFVAKSTQSANIERKSTQCSRKSIIKGLL